MIELKQGDCLELMKGLADESVDAIITDPPYFEVVSNNFDNQWRTEDDFIEWQKKWIVESFRVLKPTGSFYMFGSIKNNALLKIKLWLDLKYNFRNWITWNKTPRLQSGKKNWVNQREEILYYTKTKIFYFENPRGLPYNSIMLDKNSGKFLLKNPPYNKKDVHDLNIKIQEIGENRNWKMSKISQTKKYGEEKFHWKGKNRGNVLTGFNHLSNMRNNRDKNYHINRKPVDLISLFIEASSEKNDIILDPFMGSGTTGVACINTSRNYIGYELDPDYFKIAEARITNAQSKADKRLL
jgi:DNA modification methylase